LLFSAFHLKKSAEKQKQTVPKVDQHLNNALIARELLDGCFGNVDVIEGTRTEGRSGRSVLGGD
jgi:hypothetical protein